MAVELMERVSQYLLIAMIVCFIITVFLFFRLKIRKAWNIIFETNFQLSSISRKVKSKNIRGGIEKGKSHRNQFALCGGADMTLGCDDTIVMGTAVMEEMILRDACAEEATEESGKKTTVLTRDSLEMIVDIMLIHTQMEM